MANRTSRLARLRALGFDRSEYVGPGHGWTVRCSQCEALVICGVPCHEIGCPNKPVVCKECGEVGHRDCGLYPAEEAS